MPHYRTTTLLDLTSSMSLLDDRMDFSKDHFKWASIKKFIYLAFTFSASSSNFDLFSKVVENVRIYDFIIFELTIGMTYMCMDVFIKQYTRKLDFNKSLNPMLKGITYGILLQSGLWTLIHASDLADSVRLLVTSLQSVPSWSKCQRTFGTNVSCVTSKDIIIRCREKQLTNLNITSAHINYQKSFSHFDRHVLTTRFFAVALVWIFNFFFTTVTDNTLLKLFKIAFIWRFLSTLIILILIMFTTKYHASIAFFQMMDITAPRTYSASVDHVTYAYGIGFVGVYDFGTMSPYTMIDNAVILFTIVFTVVSFARSFIVRILYLVLTSCVEVEISITPHYLLFAILPLSTEFLYAHRLYIIYIYANIMIATIAYLSMLTLSMSKLLHAEFRSIKNIYIVGILCFLGFSLSVPITVSMSSSSRLLGLIYGLNVTVLYLGGFKVAVVMWVYGVRRFSTDVHFWLGFKPTKFWTICWMLLPIVLFVLVLYRLYKLTQMDDLSQSITAAAWIGFSLLIVAIFHVKTIARYLLRNNLAGAFSSKKTYGPPDKEDRKRRQVYSETARLRQCTHNCHILDDVFDCFHIPIVSRSKIFASSSESLTHIYEAGTSKKLSDAIDVGLSHH
ncbi:sodium-dependent dopamine transporter-like [Galleria mellonella]|uniref:Sodium-dependent dopamine transporter-like n=1 Tax=Galleria mellonella TaxID=7137 RepID=A0A6J1WXN0_GALME|nr:sodium-dependent dopamine transporter-like [Galleria mellonella]